MKIFTPGNLNEYLQNKNHRITLKSIRIFSMLFLLIAAFRPSAEAQAQLPACNVISAGSGCNSLLQAHIGQHVPYSANLVNNVGATYFWDFSYNSSGASILSGQGTMNPVINAGATAGQYTLRLRATTSQGTTSCSASVVVDCMAINTAFTPISCFGGTSALTVTASGSTGPYTYTLQQGNITNNTGMFPGLGAGTYNITVSSAAGCTLATNVVIAQPSAALTATATHNNVVCYGTATGSIDLSVSGGTAPYTYSWQGAVSGVVPAGQANNQDLTGLVAGTYRVYVTDANACSAVETVVISQPAQALAASYVQVNPGCDSIGIINLSPFGGYAPYSYVWTATNGGVIPAGQENGQDLYNIIPGTYSVVVTDSGGCAVTSTAMVTASSAALVATATQTNVSCSGGSNGSVNLTVTGGTMPYSYLWTASNGGVVPAGQSNAEDLTGLVAGIYHVVVTSANGCAATKNIVITAAPALMATIDQTNVGCYGSSTGSINLSVNGGTAPYTYLWVTLDGTIPAGQSTAQDLSGLVPGTYRVYVTDSNACSTIATAMITQPVQAQAASYVQVNHGCDSIGIINLSPFGGWAPYSYVWTATNGGVIPAGQENGQDLYDILPGTYHVVVTDSSGCSITVTAVITQSSDSLVATATQTNVGCSGAPTGSINLTVTGGSMPYTYLWTASNGGVVPAGQSASEDLNGLAAGIYHVVVTSSNGGCVTTKNVLITSGLINITYTQINPECNLSGSIHVNVNGGNPPYTYLWTASNGGIVPAGQATNKDLQDLVAGTYTIVVTDISGCTNTSTVTITQKTCTHPEFGCSHGFWKNHIKYWDQLSTYTVSHMPANMQFVTTTNFYTYFNLAPGTGGLPNSLSMLGALQLQGGQCKAFSRDAVTALLDVASGQNVPFPAGTNDFISLYTAIRTALLNSDCDGSLRHALGAIVKSCHDGEDEDDDDDRMSPVINPVSVSAYPNPFDNYTGKISFKIRSEVAGNAHFELYDLVGTKLGVLYNGYLEKNVDKIITYTVPANNKKTIIYRLVVGDKTSSGKVLLAN